MQLLFISILVCQAPSAPSLILVSLHSFFFLSFFLPESEKIAGSACSEGCRRRDDGLMQQQTLEMMTQIGSSGSFKLFGSELLWCIYITRPEPREATRLQLENKKEGLVAHLSATLCVHGDLELYRYHVSSVCLLVCLASQIFFKNFCNMFVFLKSQSQNVISATLLCKQ
jgi:hypothetical protein